MCTRYIFFGSGNHFASVLPVLLLCEAGGRHAPAWLEKGGNEIGGKWHLTPKIALRRRRTLLGGVGFTQNGENRNENWRIPSLVLLSSSPPEMQNPLLTLVGCLPS